MNAMAIRVREGERKKREVEPMKQRKSRQKAGRAPPSRPVDRLDDPVVLINGKGKPAGTASKLAAHQRGLRHQAISVIIRNEAGHILLQRRNLEKYHSGGEWTNACCSHPRPGEKATAAARRRLREEMGISVPLKFLFQTEYRATVSADLVEHEVVDVFAGTFEGTPHPDPDEVADWCWIRPDALRIDMHHNARRYTPWFHTYVDQHWSQLSA
jgi:isopentenyl-diphosphate delta-isomerase